MKKSFVLLLIGLVAIAGCKNKLSKVAGMMNTDDEKEVQNNIVEIYNNLFPKVEHTIKEYSKIFDYEEGPHGTEKSIENSIWVLDLKADYSTNEKFEAFKKAASDDELSKIGQAYIDAYQEMSKNLEEMKSYYKRGDYKDDNFAKGKQLHTSFKQQVELYYKYQDKILTFLEENEDKQNKEELKVARESGQKGKERFYQMTILSKELLNLSEKPIDKIDKAQYKAKVDEFEKSITDFSATLNSKKGELKNDTYKNALALTLESYLKSTDDYYAKIKIMNRKLESPEKEKISHEDLKEEIIYSYNNMVGSYNTVMQYKGYFEF